jgi:GNAT superfamily N-acetyltransferase
MNEIRPARPGDAGFIIEAQLAMAQETEGLALDRRTVALGVAAVFDEPTKGEYFLAEMDGEAAGCLLTIPEWSDWRNGTVLWIHSLYVRPECRGQGAFRAMYEFLRQKVEADEKLKGLRLYVDKTNAQARQIYDAVGMDGKHYRMFEWMKP